MPSLPAIRPQPPPSLPPPDKLHHHPISQAGNTRVVLNLFLSLYLSNPLTVRRTKHFPNQRTSPVSLEPQPRPTPPSPRSFRPAMHTAHSELDGTTLVAGPGHTTPWRLPTEQRGPSRVLAWASKTLNGLGPPVSYHISYPPLLPCPSTRVPLWECPPATFPPEPPASPLLWSPRWLPPQNFPQLLTHLFLFPPL